MSDSKLKNVFAVVHNGYLYFNIAAILVNRNKNDRAQTSDFPNSYTKVILGAKTTFIPKRNLQMFGQKVLPIAQEPQEVG